MALGRQRGYDAAIPDLWFHALSGDLTTETSLRVAGLSHLVTDAQSAVPMVRTLIEARPTGRIVVSPAYERSMRNELGFPGDRGIVTWPESGSVQTDGEG